ncbi:MAG: hypothetical protein M3252_07550 [Actinomycetota bacterium]|nr:hypothetical protein [Actinomycetota bacterium]
MRGDLALQLRIALRPRGLLGIAGAVAGMVGVVAVYLPWYELGAKVTLLGHARGRSIATLAGWQAQPWIWAAATISVFAAAIGVAVALDRPPPMTRRILLALGLALGALAGLSALLVPASSRFLADPRFDQLEAVAGRLPDDVALDLAVRPAIGLWITLTVAVLLLLVALAIREV